MWLRGFPPNPPPLIVFRPLKKTLVLFVSSLRLYDVFPQGMGFVLVFEFMVSDLSEMIRDASNPLSPPQVNIVVLLKDTYMHVYKNKNL